MVIGMFTDCEMENVYAVGNAAGDGVRIALLNKAKRDEANVIDYMKALQHPDGVRWFWNKNPTHEEVLQHGTNQKQLCRMRCSSAVFCICVDGRERPHGKRGQGGA
jgi:hypothetical protein